MFRFLTVVVLTGIAIEMMRRDSFSAPSLTAWLVCGVFVFVGGAIIPALFDAWREYCALPARRAAEEDIRRRLEAPRS
jgi:hypothetical protein